MDRDKALKEMIETVNEFGECVVNTKDGDQYDISLANYHVGGKEGYYMSSHLGKVQYDNLEEICVELLSRIDVSQIEGIDIYPLCT